MAEPITVAAVEGGGTSFVVAIAEISSENPIRLLKKAVFDSSKDPQTTLQACASYLSENKPHGGYHALGLATFGPLGVNPDSKERYGRILSTSPKAAWRNVNLLAPLAKAAKGSRPLAVRVETDVNAPALAEFELVSGISSLAYITVGTGVGVGMVVNGKCVHGRMHSEGGHVPVQPLENDPFRGYSWGQKSPFQGKQTVEGIASSVALTERLSQLEGRDHASRHVLADLPDDHEVWDHAANAIANLCVTLLLTVSIEKIVIGGGIMKRQGLLEKIQERTILLLNGYLELPSDMSTLINTSRYNDEAGLMGAIVLAQRAYLDEQEGQLIKAGDSSNRYKAGFARGVVMGASLAVAGGLMLLAGRRRKP